jgi:hypothetical protein
MDLREIPSHAFRRHPWERVRAHFFMRLLRDHVKSAAMSVVDFGSGDGFFAKALTVGWPEVTRVVCFDPAYPANQGPGSESRIAFTRNKPEGAFDVLLLLDVLEHDANDQATLHDALSNCLRPGGWLLLSVPAHPILFSRHDELLGHKRRYSPAAVLALARNENVEIIEHGQLFASLVVPRALAKLGETFGSWREDRLAASAQVETSLGNWRHGPLVTRAVETMLGMDAAFTRALARRQIGVPGLSTWILARKR